MNETWFMVAAVFCAGVMVGVMGALEYISVWTMAGAIIGAFVLAFVLERKGVQ